MIEVGESVPDVAVRLVTADGVEETTSRAILGQGRIAFFSVPGAFTPGCHINHLPGFLANANKLRAAGITRIVCAAVNDHHVLKAWGEASDAMGIVDFIADPRAVLAQGLGLAQEFEHLGVRYRRSSLVLRDGVAEAVFVEDAPGVKATGAPAMLEAMSAEA